MEDTFEAKRKAHDIKTCPICIQNQKYKEEGKTYRILSLDGIHGNSLVD